MCPDAADKPLKETAVQCTVLPLSLNRANKHARSKLDIKPGCQVVDLKRDFAFADNEFDMSLCLGTLTYMEPVARWLFTSLWQSPSKKSKAFLYPGDRGMERRPTIVRTGTHSLGTHEGSDLSIQPRDCPIPIVLTALSCKQLSFVAESKIKIKSLQILQSVIFQ